MFELTETFPTLNQTDVLITTEELLFTFNEDLDLRYVSDLVLSVGIADSSPFMPVDGSVSLAAANILKFKPTAALSYGIKYVVVLAGGEFGVHSTLGHTLATDYLYYFTTENAPAVPDSPVDMPIDGIPLNTVTGLHPTAVTNSLGKLILTYAEDLPVGTTALIRSRHPLGRPGGTDLWIEYVSVSVSGNRITFESSSDISIDYKSRLVNTTSNTAVLLDNSIPVVSSTINTDPETELEVNVSAVLDLAVNREYTVTIITSEGQHIVTHLSYLAPFFLSIEDAKLQLRGLESVFENDRELYLTIYLESLRAYHLWTGHNNAWPDYIPYYVAEFVRIRLILDALELNARRTTISGQAESFSLGDLKISVADSSSTSSGDTTVDRKELAQWEYILGECLRKGDKRTLPIYEPAYSLMAPSSNYGVIGLVPSIGRQDPTFDPRFDRDLNHYVPGKRSFKSGREID
ncbi:Ig-like domain-containing protein [Acinetobacter sp.]|uniref:Ig-like domain-containing protein n=1 Tax=Acinetobacter sp. TaxID=472 RepID=UPI003D080D63